MKRRSLALVAGVLGFGLVLTGCAPGTAGSSNATTPADAAKKLTAEDVAALGDVTLAITDMGADEILNAALTEVADRFMAAYPNVKVTRDIKNPTAYHDTLKLTMSAADAPDIAQASVVDARALASGQLLTPLDGYYDAYGWGDAIPTSAQFGLRLSADGKNLGEGNLWGTGPGGNMIVVYYNKSLLSSLGDKVPTTLDEFNKTLADAKAAGVNAISMGNSDRYPGAHAFMALSSALVPQEAITSWVSGASGSTFAEEGNLAAATQLLEWANAGYLPENVNAITAADGQASFRAGDGLFYIGTTYVMGAISDALGENVGVFAMPGKTATDATVPLTGAMGNAFAIGSKSTKKDLAAFYLNFMAQSDLAEVFVKAGYFPFGGDYQASADSPVINAGLTLWRDTIRANGFEPFRDWASIDLGADFTPEIQNLVGGQSTPQQFVDRIQSIWAESYGG